MLQHTVTHAAPPAPVALLAQVLERAPVAMSVVDVNGKFIWCNPAYTRLTGWEVEQLRGRFPNEVLEGPATGHAAIQRTHEARTRGEAFTVELVQYRRSGESYWARVESHPILDEGGQLSCWLSSVSDISQTRQKQRREALGRELSEVVTRGGAGADSTALALACVGRCVDAAEVALWRLDGGSLSRVARWGSRDGLDESLLGGDGPTTEAEWLGWRGLTSAAEQAWGGQAHPIDVGPNAGGALPLHLGGERAGWLEVLRPAPLMLCDEEAVLLGSVEHPLAGILAALRAQAATAAGHAAAAAAEKEKSDLLDRMSLEIRTPLTGLLGLAGMLEDTPLSPHQQDLLAGLQSSGASLLAMVDDILDLAKLESGGSQPTEAEYDLDALIDELMRAMEPRARLRGLGLRVGIEGGVPEVVWGDPVRLRQALSALLSHVLEASSSGDLTLDCSVDGDRLAFTVRHLPAQADLEDELDHFAVIGANPGRPGAGVGLALVTRITAALGGTYSSTPLDDGGHRHSLSLPLRAGREPESWRRTAAGLRVVGAESSDHERRSLHAALAGHLPAPVVLSSAAGLAAALTGDFEVLLLDPALLTPEVTRALAGARQRLPRLRVVVLGAASAVPPGLTRPQDSLVARPVGRRRLRAALAGGDAPAANAASTSGESRTRLLLVEDNEINARLAGYLLDRLGFDVDHVVNGARAVERFANRWYPGVLMDCHMPEMDGYEATRRIRQLEASAGGKLPATRIVAVTANALAGERARCLEAGMDEYLTKPVSREALRRALAGLARPEAHTVDGAVATTLAALVSELGEATVHDLLSSWLTDVPLRIAAMTSLAEKPDFPSLRRAAHSLKGTSALFGVAALQAACGALEDSALVGNADDTRSAHARVEHCWAEAEPGLRVALARIHASA